ncbi:MAG: 1,4-dihydroxy-2-naphthoate octaprenyltransferase [Deltaproteobacteria bacterium]|jgi:1,4-dihydroxy-2-naphthoate octaprenyltransferase
MNRYKNWFLAMRPWSFSMSVISVSVGAAFAATQGPFSWPLYVLTAVAMVSIHGGVNLMNDYFDYRSGVDIAGVATTQYRPHPLAEGKIYPVSVLWVSIALFSLGAALGILLAYLRGWEILWIGIFGVAAGVLYTAPPVSYKYHAWGELSVFLMWGPLAVEAAYFIQTGFFSWSAFWVSLPFGTLVALTLFANNLRDVNTDAKAHVNNLAIILGRHRGPAVYAAMVLAALLSVVVMSIFGPLEKYSLLVILSLPVAVKLLKMMIHEVPRDADARTAQLNTAFGALLVISLIIESIV